ncbi:MAG: AMP-binding protein, partial [Rhodospirillaceae bacterium]|nr:AMP-binding protein [Rhodospirillaceae bacterium]
MTYDDWPNLATMFFDIAGQYGDRPFLWDKLDGSYVPRNWASIADEVRALSAGLRETGVESGDRVVLVAENGTNWVIADLAIIAAGAITVPAYTTNTEAL